MAIEIVDFPMKNGDFPVRYVKLPEGKPIPGHDQRSRSLVPGNPGVAARCPAWASNDAREPFRFRARRAVPRSKRFMTSDQGDVFLKWNNIMVS